MTGLAMSVADREEFSSPWVGMWWAITTVTTVGYGDYAPRTAAGRGSAARLMATLQRIEERLDRLEAHVREPG